MQRRPPCIGLPDAALSDACVGCVAADALLAVRHEGQPGTVGAAALACLRRSAIAAGLRVDAAAAEAGHQEEETSCYPMAASGSTPVVMGAPDIIVGAGGPPWQQHLVRGVSSDAGSVPWAFPWAGPKMVFH